jgi:hypothetical protein
MKITELLEVLHQHYIESQLLVGQLLLPFLCCHCTSRSVVALAVGAVAVGCALIVTPGVADDTQVLLSEIRLHKECGPS